MVVIPNVVCTSYFPHFIITTLFFCFALSVDIHENSGISSDADSGTDTPVRTGALLDLYSGCGGMSTGLCLGAALAGLQLETVKTVLYIWLKSLLVIGFSTNSILFLVEMGC